jgi:hypothetical protein
VAFKVASAASDERFFLKAARLTRLDLGATFWLVEALTRAGQSGKKELGEAFTKMTTISTFRSARRSAGRAWPDLTLREPPKLDAAPDQRIATG